MRRRRLIAGLAGVPLLGAGAAEPAPWGWLGVVAPALILYLILFVTGVKPAEEQALKSRGDDFRRYQRETSVFIPWLPRSSTA